MKRQKMRKEKLRKRKMNRKKIRNISLEAALFGKRQERKDWKR